MTTATLRTDSTGEVDTLGVSILIGDTVIVTGWGWAARLGDTGRRAPVTGVTAAGNIVVDSSAYAPDLIGRGRALNPATVAVARRDGTPGLEGNR